VLKSIEHFLEFIAYLGERKKEMRERGDREERGWGRERGREREGEGGNRGKREGERGRDRDRLALVWLSHHCSILPSSTFSPRVDPAAHQTK
jgi:hypothetical protein